MKHYSIREWKDYVNGNTCGLENALMEQHLSNCSECLERYLNALEESDHLYHAPDNITDRIMAAVDLAESCRHNYKVGRNNVNRGKIKTISRFAVAASIALLLWHFGIFGRLSMSVLKVDELFLTSREPEMVLADGFGDRMINQLNNFFDTISYKGDVIFNENEK